MRTKFRIPFLLIVAFCLRSVCRRGPVRPGSVHSAGTEPSMPTPVG